MAAASIGSEPNAFGEALRSQIPPLCPNNGISLDPIRPDAKNDAIRIVGQHQLVKRKRENANELVAGCLLWQGQVESKAHPVRPTTSLFGGIARWGEESRSSTMERHGEDLVRVVEGRLYAIGVVDIDIKIQYSLLFR
jgi:hypothetical protein